MGRPDLVSSLPGNKGSPLPSLPNLLKRNEIEGKEQVSKGMKCGKGKFRRAGADMARELGWFSGQLRGWQQPKAHGFCNSEPA